MSVVFIYYASIDASTVLSVGASSTVFRSFLSIAPAMPYHCPPVLPSTVLSIASSLSSVLPKCPQYYLSTTPLSSVPCPQPWVRPGPGCPAQVDCAPRCARPPRRAGQLQVAWLPCSGPGSLSVSRITIITVSPCTMSPAVSTLHLPPPLVTCTLLGTLVLVLALARPGNTPHFPRQARYGTLTTWWWRI